MKRSGQNVRQRSRVQGAWSQPPAQRLNSQQPQRSWQRGDSGKEFQAEQTDSAVPGLSYQQDLALYGHGCHTSSAVKHAESLQPQMPKNFSWVVDGHICAMGFPGQPENILYLIQNNVRYLISLTAERQPSVDAFPELTLIPIKVVDFTPPTVEQVEQCLSVFEKAGQEGKAVGIHCNLGKGRTGTVLACYFVKFHQLDPGRAIQQLKRLRKGSVQTLEQENAVKIFAKHLNFSNMEHKS